MRRTEQLAHEAGITVNAVALLPEGTPVPFRVEEGYTLFQTRPLRIYDMYRITQA